MRVARALVEGAPRLILTDGVIAVAAPEEYTDPLALLGAMAVKLYFTEERLKALIVPGIESATNRKADLGGVHTAPPAVASHRPPCGRRPRPRTGGAA